jgi:hypothetical protein
VPDPSEKCYYPTRKVAAMAFVLHSVIAIATIATALVGSVNLVGAQGSAKAKSSPDAAPNLAADPGKKKTGGEDSRGLWQINIDPKRKSTDGKWRAIQGGGLRINE